MARWDPKIAEVSGVMHTHLLREAYEYAWENSEDTTTKTGAVIYKDGKIVSEGANHFPKGVKPTGEQLADRDWRLKHVIHAEPSAIYAAAKAGKSVDGATMYMPWVPCVPCAKAIIDSGISQLIGHEAMIMMTPERWWDDCGYAVRLLENCGIDVRMYYGKIGNVKGLMNGIEWEP